MEWYLKTFSWPLLLRTNATLSLRKEGLHFADFHEVKGVLVSTVGTLCNRSWSVVCAMCAYMYTGMCFRLSKGYEQLKCKTMIKESWGTQVETGDEARDWVLYHKMLMYTAIHDTLLSI